MPLTADEVRQFLQEVFGEAPPVELVDRLHRRTRGNPFFLEELVIAAREGSRTGRSPSAVGPPSLLDARLPWTTSEAVLDRLEGLDPSNRELLQSAAVVGDPFDLPSLGAATGWADTEVLATVESLIRAGLLVGLPGGLLTSTTPGRRRRRTADPPQGLRRPVSA